MDISKEELDDIEGLAYLRWSMFDSPDKKGSGKMFMEREPVFALDRIVRRNRFILDIELGYTSKKVADDMYLATNDSHRVGRAIRIRCVGNKKRMLLVKGLIEEGITRIAVNRETVYFDTDDQKERGFILW